jgi:hypothetical protein
MFMELPGKNPSSSIIETLLKSMQNAPVAPGDSSSTFLYIESLLKQMGNAPRTPRANSSTFLDQISIQSPWKVFLELLESSLSNPHSNLWGMLQMFPGPIPSSCLMKSPSE